MKILINGSPKFLDQKYSFAGAHIFAEDFLDFLGTTRHSFTGLAFLKPSSEPAGNFRVTARKAGENRWLVISTLITSQEIFDLADGKKSPKATRLIRDLARLMGAQKADLFFLNGFSAMAYLLLVAARQAGLPVVAMHHGIWLREAQALARHAKTDNRPRLKKLEGRIVQWARKNIFLNRHSVRAYEKSVRKIPKGQIETITLPYNPVFLNKRKIPKPRNRRQKIALVGRWDRVKNHEAFLGLAKAAQAAGKNWEFMAVTQMNHYPPYDDIKDEYLKWVKIIKPMPPAKLKKFLQGVDLVVVPSHFETYSAVVMETMLQNRPVLVSPNLPWAETFQKAGRGRWVTDFKNPAKTVKIAEAAMLQVPPPKLVQSLVKAGHPRTVQNKYLKVMESVINSRTR